MKTRIYSRIIGCIVGILTLGIGAVHAQNCEAYYPMKTGAYMELTHYDGKGKVSSVTQSTVKDIKTYDGGIMAEIHAVTLDGKGKELSQNDFNATCQSGEFKMDMKSMGGSMPQMQGMKDLEIKMEGTDMVYPGTLSVGQSLPDAELHMTGIMNGMTIMNNTITVTNRKVVAKESVTTPAGTFNCVLIEEDSKMAGAMGMNFQTHTKSWMALGTGMVKSEGYHDGKLQSSSVLTKISGN